MALRHIDARFWKISLLGPTTATADRKVLARFTNGAAALVEASIGNGRTLLTSEGYTSRTGALNGVLSVLDNGVDPAMYQLNKTASGKYNLRLRAANNQIIAFTRTLATGFSDLSVGMKKPTLAALLGLPMLIGYELAQYRAGTATFYRRLPAPLRGALIATLIFITLLGTSNEPAQFIYFQF